MIDDIIHSAQYYIKYINKAILSNLQHRPLKHGKLIVLYETRLQLSKILFPWQLTIFQSSPTWSQYVSDFQLENIKQCHKLKQISKWNSKGEPKSLNIGEVWNPVWYHGNKTVKLVFQHTFSRISAAKNKHIWCKLAEISFFFVFGQNLVECMP